MATPVGTYTENDGATRDNIGVVMMDPATNAPGALGTKPTAAATSARTNVPAAAADTPVLAANANRLPGSTIANDSTAIMYVLLGAGAASATNYTVAIDGIGTIPGVYFIPDGWTGAVHGYWASATGNARVTELSA